MASRPDQAELNAMARRVIDANHYMTLATQDADGRPRLSPLYYTCARYSDFYWVSSPTAHHSRNLGSRPDVEIVIFDSSAPVGQGEAVYAAIMTFVILKVLGLVMSLRAVTRIEGVGMDVSQHGEEAYASGEGSILVPPEAALVPEPLPAFTPQVASR